MDCGVFIYIYKLHFNYFLRKTQLKQLCCQYTDIIKAFNSLRDSYNIAAASL